MDSNPNLNSNPYLSPNSEGENGMEWIDGAEEGIKRGAGWTKCGAEEGIKHRAEEGIECGSEKGQNAEERRDKMRSGGRDKTQSIRGD